MPKIKLIALDLDGTLLTSDKRISERNLTAVKRAQKAGVRVVLDTGRPLISTVEYLETLGMTGADDYCVTFNGALVQNCQGDIIDEQRLDYAAVAEIADWAREVGLPMDIISETIAYEVEQGRPSLLHYVNNTLDFQKVPFDAVPEDAVFNKIILTAEDTFLDSVYDKVPDVLREKYEFFKTRAMMFEVMAKGVTKGSGLVKLCEHLDIALSDVLAIGDEGNDVPMLEVAGLGIAPANALHGAKKAANVVSSLSNDEDCVAHAIEKYVLTA